MSRRHHVQNSQPRRWVCAPPTMSYFAVNRNVPRGTRPNYLQCRHMQACLWRMLFSYISTLFRHEWMIAYSWQETRRLKQNITWCHKSGPVEKVSFAEIDKTSSTVTLLLFITELFCLYRVQLKKMTQHLKCDYSVISGNFCAKFCTVVQEGAVH